MSEPENPSLLKWKGKYSSPDWATTDITLRDLFAMAALYGLQSKFTWASLGELAQTAYRVGDAMLAERAKGKE